MIIGVNNHRNYGDSSEAALTVENLSKVYVSAMGKVVSLRNVNFSVNKGEFVSVVGPSSSPSKNTNSSPLSTSSSTSSTSRSNTTNASGNNSRSSNGNSSGGITVSPSYTSSSIMPKAITDNNRVHENLPIVPVSYKIAKGNNTGTTTSANASHTSSKGLSHRSAAITKSATAGSNNNQLNSTSLILVSGNTEDMKFSVANNNNSPITNAVISIASQTSGLKIVGDTLWSLASIAPHTSQQFSTKIFASTSLIAQPVSFLVTMQYISQGQSQVGSFILGGTVIGSIHVSASGIGINYIAGVPNLVGNLLNEGNTIGLYSTVQLINQPFSTVNGSSTTNQQQHPHHHNQPGVGSAGGGQWSSSTTASTTKSNQSSAPTSLPPPQYLGDLQPDSPLPFTGFLSGIFGGGGGSRHSRGGGQTSSAGDILGIPLPIVMAIIAAIAVAFILIRRRRKSRAALVTSADLQEEEGDNEDIESLIDGSHKSVDTKKKEGGGTKPPI